MRKILSLILIINVSLIGLSCKKSDYGSEEHSIPINGEKRSFLLHEISARDTLSPLILALHGGTGSAINIEEQSLLSSTADENGFFVCYPEGKYKTWNAGACCGKAEKKEVDDVQFISELIDHLVTTYPIDPSRVYLTGMSNGGFMCYRLACELSEKIAAIAPVAATMNFENCNPANPVPIMHFHSYKDSNVPWEGGVGDGISSHHNQPIVDVLNDWSSHNSCSSTGNINEKENFDEYHWSSCDTVAPIILYLTNDGGHAWPMGTKPRSRADEPSTAVNANDLMWAFFQQFTRD